MRFETRNDMVNYYVQPNTVGCEIGVFRGEFSKILLERNPAKLYLVDVFEGECRSGDHDGNNLIHIKNLDGVYKLLLQKYQNEKRVELVKSKSENFLLTLRDRTLDYIYIDGDHTEIGCMKDLILASQKVKIGGYIMCHDYSVTEKCNYDPVVHDFGVKDAVDKFCAKNGLCIEAIAHDGCTTCCIINN